VSRVIGFDPSMSNWGIAVGLYNEKTDVVSITDLDIIKPEKLTSKKISRSHKDLLSATQLASGVFDVIRWYKPDFIYVEVPHGSQSARAAVGYGICIGILGSLKATGHNFTELRESQVKMATVGSRKATKEEMIQWAVKRHKEANWPKHKRDGKAVITTGTAEHMADAVATIYAGVKGNNNES